MRNRFSDDEWARLKFLPFQAFILVAAADGKMDDHEVHVLADQIERSALLIDPLHRALLIELADEDQSPYMEAASPEKLRETSEALAPLLRSRLSEAEYEGFVRSVFIATVHVARASGGGVLGAGIQVSTEEAAALAAIARLYDVDVHVLI
jgi:hypothetical protein